MIFQKNNQKGRTNAPESNCSVGCIRSENAFQSAKRTNQCTRVEFFGRLHPIGKCIPECKKGELMLQSRMFRWVTTDQKMHSMVRKGRTNARESNFLSVAPDRKMHSRVQKGRTNAQESNFQVGCIRSENASECIPECKKDEQMHQSRIFQSVASDREMHSRVQKGRTNAPESNFSVGSIRSKNAFLSAKRTNQCTRVDFFGRLHPIGKCIPECKKDEPMHLTS